MPATHETPGTAIRLRLISWVPAASGTGQKARTQFTEFLSGAGNYVRVTLSELGNYVSADTCSAGINASEQDVARLLVAVARLVTGEPPVRYRRNPSAGDFYPREGRRPRSRAVRLEQRRVPSELEKIQHAGPSARTIVVSVPVAMSRSYQPAGPRVRRIRRPGSGHDQQAGLVVNVGTGRPQAGLADPEVVAAQQQLNGVRAAGSRRHYHGDHRPCRAATSPRTNVQRYGSLQLGDELLARGGRPARPPTLHMLTIAPAWTGHLGSLFPLGMAMSPASPAPARLPVTGGLSR